MIFVMKKILIVTAHPSSQGFVHKMAETYSSASKAKGNSVEILDLYDAKNAQPFLKFETEKEWPREKVSEMQQKIATADEIILSFPVWWGDAPAILKNWLDYNFTGGFAYKYTAKGVDKLLAGKTARIFATADAPGIAYSFFLAPMRLSWTKLRLAFCGVKVTTFNVYGTMRKRNEQSRKKILEEVARLATK
jgi:putative NADPH-quinone reductase